MRRISVVLVGVALAGACKTHHGGTGTGGGGGGDRPREAPAIPGQVQLIVDGKAIGNADRAAAAAWSRVADLLPADDRDTKQWTAIEIHTHSGRITTMPDPSGAQPGLIAAIFPGKDGIDFGMFTPDELAKHGTPKMIEMDVSDVRVKRAPSDTGSGSGSDGSGSASDSGSGGSGGGNGEGGAANRTGGDRDLTGIKLTIKQPKSADVEISGDDLGKIAMTTAPMGDTSSKGWDVATVLAAEKIKPTAKLIITDEGGASVTMTAKQLDPKTDLAFMKVNKQGQIRFRLFEKNAGGAWDVAGELRGVTTIELLP